MMAADVVSDAPLRVLVADPQPVFRAGLRALIDGAVDLTCAAEAGDLASALELVSRVRLDVIAVDPQLGGAVEPVVRRLLAAQHTGGVRIQPAERGQFSRDADSSRASSA